MCTRICSPARFESGLFQEAIEVYTHTFQETEYMASKVGLRFVTGSKMC